MSMFGDDISILARKTCCPGSTPPSFICLKSLVFSSTVLFLKGLFFPTSLGVPFCSAICSDV